MRLRLNLLKLFLALVVSLLGNGTLAILVDGSQPEKESFDFLDKLFETLTSVNVFKYKLAIMLLGVMIDLID